MSNNKQSSVEWVIENLTLIHALLSRREIGVEFFNRKYNEIVERGKAMHEEEVIDAHGVQYDYSYSQIDPKKVTGEQYYEQTFGGNK